MPFDTPGEIPTPIMSIGVTDNSGGTHNGAPVVNLDWFGTAEPTVVVAEADPETKLVRLNFDESAVTLAQIREALDEVGFSPD